MEYWIVKTEPGTYSFDDLLRDGTTVWDGVRNYQARNNLRAMKEGDTVFVYHSVIDKEVVGISKVSKESFQDPTSDDPRWLSVELKAVRSLRVPLSLEQIKADPFFSNVALVKHSRLSVMPIQKEAAEYLMKLAG